MDRIIEVKVGGNYLSKDSKNAGVKGEGNVTNLRITFDEGWDGYAKKVTFWDARGLNPVARTLTTDLLEDITESTLIYLVPIPPEPMAEAGMMTFVIDGYVDGKRQRSLSDALEVKDAPIADDAGEPTDPTPTQAEQLQEQIDTIIDDIQTAAISAESAKESADIATEKATEATKASSQAEAYALQAKESVGKTSYIGENGNWYAWDLTLGEFYDTGVKAQAGSIVWLGANPPEEADVWIDPDGNGGVNITTIEDLINEVGYAKHIADEAHGQSQSNSTGIEWLTEQVGDLTTATLKQPNGTYYDNIVRLVNAVHQKLNTEVGGLYLHTDGLYGQHASDIEAIRKDLNEESHFRGYVAENINILSLKATQNDFVYSAESGTKWVYDGKVWSDTGSPVPDQLTPASDTTPLMNGTASVGAENAYARGDHRHPTDITRASVAEVNELRSQIGDIATLLGGI